MSSRAATDSIGVGPTYTYPDGRTVQVPGPYRHLEHVTLSMLESRLAGADLRSDVVVSVDGISLCDPRSGRYRKPSGDHPHPSRDVYYRGICRTEFDDDGVERLVNPRLIPDSYLARFLVEPVGYTCEVGVYGPGLVGRRRTYRPIARRNANWLGGQIVGLDLDGAGPATSTLDGVLEACERTGLWPSFIYCSGSCSCETTGLHDRIRPVFILDRFVTDPALMDGLVAAVGGMFGAEHAFDRARVLYGGRFLIHEDLGRRVSPELIIRAAAEHLELDSRGTRAATYHHPTRSGASGASGADGGGPPVGTPLIDIKGRAIHGGSPAPPHLGDEGTALVPSMRVCDPAMRETATTPASPDRQGPMDSDGGCSISDGNAHELVPSSPAVDVGRRLRRRPSRVPNPRDNAPPGNTEGWAIQEVTPPPPPPPAPPDARPSSPARPKAVRVRRLEEKLASQCALWRDLVAGSEDEIVETTSRSPHPDESADESAVSLIGGVVSHGPGTRVVPSSPDRGDARWLHYPQLLHLFSNLTAINGGAKLFTTVLAAAHSRHPDWERYDPHAWGRSKATSLTAPPSRCRPELCPHHDSCVHRGRTVVDAVRGYLGDAVVEMHPHPTVDLPEGERLLDAALYEAMSADDDLVHLVGGPPGIGKTRRMILHIRQEGGRHLVAVPTHGLGEEVLARMAEVGVAAAKRPPSPLETLPPGEERAILRWLYDLGAPDRAHIRIRERADEVPQYRDYLEGCVAADRADVTIVTHAALVRMLVGDEVGDRRIVVDEDPFSSLLRVGTARLDLLRLVASSPGWDPEPEVDSVLDGIVADIATAEPRTIRPTPRVPPGAWEAVVRRAIGRVGPEAAELDGGVLDLLRSDHHVALGNGTVMFSSRVVPPRRGMVILSATADARVCGLLFGDRVVVHPVPDVSGVGRIVQHPGSSMSRYGLSRMTGADRERLVAAVGSAPTITYAAFKGIFENPSQLHFGNLEGRDVLGGGDINIVGTHNLNPVALHLMAAELGREEACMATQRRAVNAHDGYAWTDGYCYADDPLLLLLQNYTRYSMLYQAIGRARVLRHDCTVNVWTDLPIRGAERVEG